MTVTGIAILQKKVWSASISRISLVFMPMKLLMNDLIAKRVRWKRLNLNGLLRTVGSKDVQRYIEESHDSENTNRLAMALFEDLEGL